MCNTNGYIYTKMPAIDELWPPDYTVSDFESFDFPVRSRKKKMFENIRSRAKNSI